MIIIKLTRSYKKRYSFLGRFPYFMLIYAEEEEKGLKILNRLILRLICGKIKFQNWKALREKTV